MNTPAVRFIVETIASAADRDGNIYRYGVITATTTGRRLLVSSVGGDENLTYMARRAIDASGYPTVYAIPVTIPKTLWKRKNPSSAPMEHEISDDDIRNLELPEEITV